MDLDKNEVQNILVDMAIFFPFRKIYLRDHAATILNICCTEIFALWFWAGNQKFEMFLAYEDHFWGFGRPFLAILDCFRKVYPKIGVNLRKTKISIFALLGSGDGLDELPW